jgi:hypothetical protein
MPRANRRRRDDVPLDVERARGGAAARQTYAGRDVFVRRLTGSTSERSYLCPGCQQDIAPGTPHVVVWPADGVGGVEDRRHWHSPCWGARDRRRSSGPTR